MGVHHGHDSQDSQVESPSKDSWHHTYAETRKNIYMDQSNLPFKKRFINRRFINRQDSLMMSKSVSTLKDKQDFYNQKIQEFFHGGSFPSDLLIGVHAPVTNSSFINSPSVPYKKRYRRLIPKPLSLLDPTPRDKHPSKPTMWEEAKYFRKLPEFLKNKMEKFARRDYLATRLKDPKKKKRKLTIKSGLMVSNELTDSCDLTLRLWTGLNPLSKST